MRLRKSSEVGSGALMKLMRGLGRWVRSLRRVIPSGMVATEVCFVSGESVEGRLSIGGDQPSPSELVE